MNFVPKRKLGSLKIFPGGTMHEIKNFLKYGKDWQLRLAIAILGVVLCIVIGHFWAYGGTVSCLIAACFTMSAPDIR